MHFRKTICLIGKSDLLPYPFLRRLMVDTNLYVISTSYLDHKFLHKSFNCRYSTIHTYRYMDYLRWGNVRVKQRNGQESRFRTEDLILNRKQAKGNIKESMVQDPPPHRHFKTRGPQAYVSDLFAWYRTFLLKMVWLFFSI